MQAATIINSSSQDIDSLSTDWIHSLEPEERAVIFVAVMRSVHGESVQMPVDISDRADFMMPDVMLIGLECVCVPWASAIPHIQTNALRASFLAAFGQEQGEQNALGEPEWDALCSLLEALSNDDERASYLSLEQPARNQHSS